MLPEGTEHRHKTLQCMVRSWNDIPSSGEIRVCAASISSSSPNKPKIFSHHVLLWNRVA